MKKIVKFILVVLALNFIFTQIAQAKEIHKNASEEKQQTIVITKEFVEGELRNIGKLNTTDYSYTIRNGFAVPINFAGKDWRGTEKVLEMEFDGIVKVGYLLEELNYKTIGDTVIFTIPEPHVENYVINRTITAEEEKFYNKVCPEDYEALENGVADSGLQAAVANGVFYEAENSIKDFLTNHFNTLGYNVEFI